MFKNQKGQTAVLYALLLPLIFLVGVAGIDFGWYYMNVSRLQNAADSAVVAGAQGLVKNIDNSDDPDASSEYVHYRLVDKVSDGFSEKNYDTSAGDINAKTYARKNLSDDFGKTLSDSIQDSWSKQNISFEKKFYQPADNSVEYDERKFYAYYEVILSEKLSHFFALFNSFGDMNIKVHAIAELSSVYKQGDDAEHGPTLFEQMETLKKAKVYDNFEHIQNKYEVAHQNDVAERKKEIQNLMSDGMSEDDARAKVNAEWIEKLTARYMAVGMTESKAKSAAKSDVEGNRSFTSAQEQTIQANQGNWWIKDLTVYRTENLTMRGLGGPSWDFDQYNADDLFVDFKADFVYTGKEDWDIELEKFPKMSWNEVYNSIFDVSDKNKADPEGIRHYYRIHSLVGIESARNGSKVLNKFPYKVRQKKIGSDPLYVRVESEQMKLNPYNASNHNVRNSVHQIVINVNISNYKNGDEKIQDDRPMIFFYDGPDRFSTNNHVRDSEPVILNLQADFRGVLYAPNSPVVIVGNGHKFRGFVVAKEFVKLKTEKDFTDAGYRKVVRCQMNLVDDAVDNQPIIDYNTNFDKNKDYVENNIFVKPEDILETVPTNDPADIVKNYIQVTYLGKKYFIRRDSKYFEEIKHERANAGNFSKIKVPNIIIDSVHGDVQVSEKISPTLTYSEKAKSNSEADKIFKASDFGLSSSEYSSFLMLNFVNYRYLNKSEGLDNMFETERAKKVD